MEGPRKQQIPSDSPISAAVLSVAGILPKGRDVLAPAIEAVNEIFKSLSLEGNELDDVIRLLNRERAAAGDTVVDP